MRRSIWVALLILTWGASTAISWAAKPATSETKAHQLIQVRKMATGFQIVRITRVETPLPKRRGTVRPQAWRMQLVGNQGNVVFQTGLDDPTRARGEFVDPKDPSQIQAQHVQLSGPIDFVVRVPLAAGRSLDFFKVKPEFRHRKQVEAKGLTRLGSATFPTQGPLQ